jgi:hypothetical protein
MRAAARIIREHPTVVTWAASALVWLGARYGLDVDPAVATQGAFVLLTVGLAAAHRITTPLSNPKDNQGRPLEPRRDPVLPLHEPTRYQQPPRRGGYESGTTPASELPPPSQGVRRREHWEDRDPPAPH